MTPRPRSGLPEAESARTRDLDALLDTLLLSRSHPQSAPMPRRTLHRVLACVGDADSANVLSWAREIAHLFGAGITLIHVTSPPMPELYAVGAGSPVALPLPDPAPLRERGERLLHEARDKLGSEAPEVAILQREGHAGDEIVRASRELASDIVILGHHDGGALDRLLLGSTTDHVKNHAQADVLIARGPATPGAVLAGVDGSAASRTAAQLADEIARRWSTTLHVVHVVPRTFHSEVDEAVQRELHAKAQVLGTSTSLEGVEMDLRFGEARETLRLAARATGATLIALGARGTSGLKSLIPGSVSTGLAHESPTSVLLVRSAE